MLRSRVVIGLVMVFSILSLSACENLGGASESAEGASFPEDGRPYSPPHQGEFVSLYGAPRREIRVVYINGISTERAHAETQRRYVHRVVEERLVPVHPSVSIATELHYNPTDEQPEGWLDIITQYLNLSPAMRRQVVTLAAGLGLTEDQVPGFETRIRRHLDAGRAVIVVAFSHGNFIANQAVERLLRNNRAYRGSIGLVGIATPDDELPMALAQRYAGYVTARDDLVINGVRALGSAGRGILPNRIAPSDPLPANIDNRGGARDATRHTLTRSYLAPGLPSYRAVGNLLVGISHNLRYPRRSRR